MRNIYFLLINVILLAAPVHCQDLEKSIASLKAELREQTDRIHQIEFETIDEHYSVKDGIPNESKKKRLVSKLYFKQEWIELSRDAQTLTENSKIKIRNQRNQFTVDKKNSACELIQARVAESWLDTDWPRDGAILLTPILSVDWVLSSKETEIVDVSSTVNGTTAQLVYHGASERKIYKDAQISIHFDSHFRISSSQMRFKPQERWCVYTTKYQYPTDVLSFIPATAEFRRKLEDDPYSDLLVGKILRTSMEEIDPERLKPEFYGLTQKAVDAMSGIGEPPRKFNLEFWAWLVTAIFCSVVAIYWGKNKAGNRR